jgi:hypothetical protein
MKVVPVIAALVTLAAAAQPQEPLDLDVLLDRLATYLQSYEPQLSALVADEHYVQEERRRGLALSLSKSTDAEILFLRLPGSAEWYGIRDVKKVNGKAVKGAEVTLADLLENPGADALSKVGAIIEASSRHNLGSRRTINMPTVPLEALSAVNHVRYIFKLRGTTRVRGTQTARLDFDEFDEPTLVHSVDGGNLWTRGTAWIEPSTGALWRAELIVGPTAPGTLRRPDLEAKIRVEFALDPALKLLVPQSMSESFWIRGGIGVGTGKYTNFRRFSTAARLIP